VKGKSLIPRGSQEWKLQNTTRGVSQMELKANFRATSRRERIQTWIVNGNYRVDLANNPEGGS